MVVLGVLLAAPGGAAAELATGDRVLLGESFRLAAELGEAIWPGLGEAPWEVLLVGSDHEFLVNSPRRPDGFGPLRRDPLLGELLVRARTVSPGLRATYPILGGPPVVVIGRPATTELDPTAWIAILLHEHFHQLQMSDPGYYPETEALDLAGGDGSGMWMLDFPFPYDAPEAGRRFATFCAAVAAQLEGEPGAGARQALDDLGAALPADAFRYLSFQLWQEGVARYVQYRTARLAGERFRPSPALRALPGYRPFAELAAELRSEVLAELRQPRLAERRRVAFYAAGAGLAMLLDEVAPDWRRRYLTEKFALDRFLPR